MYLSTGNKYRRVQNDIRRHEEKTKRDKIIRKHIQSNGSPKSEIEIAEYHNVVGGFIMDDEREKTSITINTLLKNYKINPDNYVLILSKLKEFGLDSSMLEREDNEYNNKLFYIIDKALETGWTPVHNGIGSNFNSPDQTVLYFTFGLNVYSIFSGASTHIDLRDPVENICKRIGIKI